jgi:hypothetical protein
MAIKPGFVKLIVPVIFLCFISNTNGNNLGKTVIGFVIEQIYS